MKPGRERFSGCLVGQALGDATGFVVESFSPEACARYIEDYLRTERVAEFGKFPFHFGQYSDDTQLARKLMRSYADLGRFDPADYAKRIVQIFAEKRIVAFGYSTKEAVKKLVQGIPWQDSGTPAPAAGNGSAMRAAPIGLFFFDNPGMLIQAAHDQGRITHKDPRSSAGAVAISGAVALALQTDRIDPGQFLATLAEWTESMDKGFASELSRLASWLSLPPKEAVERISRAGEDADHIDDDEWRGMPGYVIPSVLWSLYSFLRTPDDYWETICTSISAGGDTDTTAAMAGAISGAFLGIQAIPEAIAPKLNDRGEWKYDDLVSLAHRCHELKTAGM